MNDKTNFFKKLIFCPLFKGLSEVDIEDLFSKIEHQIKRFSKDEPIAFLGDEIKSLLIIAEGSVRGEMSDIAGKIIKIEDIEAPRPLAPAFIFGTKNKFPVSITANNNTVIIYISKQSFVRLLQLHEIVLSNFLDIVSNRAQFLSDKIKFLTFQSIKGKLALFLSELHNKTGKNEIVLKQTQTELAEMFGVTRTSLSRVIREMENGGIIRANGKNIEIKKKKKLGELMSGV